MGRIISIVLFVILSTYLFNLVATYRQNLAVELPPQSAPVIQAIDASNTDFNKTGTLVFYPNNIGPVPYLFYQDQKGHTVAKALVFPDLIPSDFSSWSGAHVSVTGHTNNEHVVISNITYLSAP